MDTPHNYSKNANQKYKQKWIPVSVGTAKICKNNYQSTHESKLINPNYKTYMMTFERYCGQPSRKIKMWLIVWRSRNRS